MAKIAKQRTGLFRVNPLVRGPSGGQSQKILSDSSSPYRKTPSLTLIQGKIKKSHFQCLKTLVSSIPFLNQGQGSVFTVRECAQSILRLEKPKNRRFSHKNPKMFDFRFNTPIPSLNQGQGSVFVVRECAESISRIKLPLRTYFLQKFSKKRN